MPPLDRRSFLRVGTLGSTGLALSRVLRAQSGGRPHASVILLWMRGGPSQHETWDPKPDAPPEVRGAFGAVRTSVPGIRICDLLPRSARIMHRWAIVRSLTHAESGHKQGHQLCMTGYPPGPQTTVNVAPSCGSVAARELQRLDPRLPAYVVIPQPFTGVGPAYLGGAYRPFCTVADPGEPGPFSVPNLAPIEGFAAGRLKGRRALHAALDRLRQDVDTRGEMAAMDRFQESAWDLVTGLEARRAFDLDAEPAHVRRRYGFMSPFEPPERGRLGVFPWAQRLLLARRLVEAGVRLVTVDCAWWDTHIEGVDTMRRAALPQWDQGFSALIEDLHVRGLLDRTMVLAWGEFGRTPRLNPRNGRDHWPGVFSAAFAGGGVQGGRVVGASDDLGAYPKENARTPQDVLATIYRHLGIDLHREYIDTAGRPRPLLPSGSPIKELF